MDMLVVRGGKRLAGEVRVGGAKNAALPIMAASLAAAGPVTLRNVPDLVDVRTQSAVLERLGVCVERDDRGTCRLSVVDENPCVAPYELVRRMRASVCVLGPLLARRGRACVSLPGGCNIGDRPIDVHLRGLAALGADIRIEQGYVVAEAARLRGATIDLCGPRGSTVTGTCNVLMAASLAHGTSVIESAAREPEVVDLADCLNRMGADIQGAGTSRLIVRGVSELHGAEHTILPDRIEAATLLCAGLITGGQVTVRGVRVAHLEAIVRQLGEVGAAVDVDGDRITASLCGRLSAADCIATPYPGVPTDVQAQITALLTQAEGTSRVVDHVFPSRFLHLPELCRLGADIRREGNAAVVRGPTKLSAANVMAGDLRASAALVLAALAANGESTVRRVYHLDRGYERLEAKLRQLGADIARKQDSPAEIPEFDALASERPPSLLTPPHFLGRSSTSAASSPASLR